MNESMSIPGGPVGVRIPAALLTTERLTEAQLDGHACVVCGRNYLTEPTATPSMPVGAVDGGQVFACAVPCASPEPVEEAEEVAGGPFIESSTTVYDGPDAVVTVLRPAEGSPVVGLYLLGEAVRFLPSQKALIAAGVILGEAEADEEASPDEIDELQSLGLGLIRAALLVRGEIEAA